MHNQTEVFELKNRDKKETSSLISDVIMDGQSECAIVVTVAYP